MRALGVDSALLSALHTVELRNQNGTCRQAGYWAPLLFLRLQVWEPSGCPPSSPGIIRLLGPPPSDPLLLLR